jgi:hypothetical protein
MVRSAPARSHAQRFFSWFAMAKERRAQIRVPLPCLRG